MCGRHGIVLSAIGISVACLSLHQLVATRRKASREIESIFKKSVWCSQSPFKPASGRIDLFVASKTEVIAFKPMLSLLLGVLNPFGNARTDAYVHGVIDLLPVEVRIENGYGLA